MKYKCKKSFCVDRYDEDGFLIENSSIRNRRRKSL